MSAGEILIREVTVKNDTTKPNSAIDAYIMQLLLFEGCFIV